MTDEKAFTGSADLRWFFWQGGFLAVGQSSGVVPTHTHHALQLVVSVSGASKLKYAEEEWKEYVAFVVNADEPHSYDGNGMTGAMVLVDPESREGKWLQASMKAPVQAMLESRVADTQAAIAKFIEEPPDLEGTTQLADFIVRQFCTGIMPNAAIDERIATVIEAIHDMDAVTVSLDEMAAKVFLSPSRFAHLFTDEVGIPFRRFLLWRRLNKAMVLASRGQSLSRAAHAAGFSDSAHLTRTFYDMFGIPPTAMLKAGTVYEIPAPFELAKRS
jgi:AraC-like DNA-binding protein